MNIVNNYWANRKWKNGHRVGTYVAYWKDEDGRTRHESGFEERQFALAHARSMSLEVKQRLASNRFIARKPWGQALSEYCSKTDGHKGIISPATQRLHKKHLMAFFNCGLIETIDEIDIDVVSKYGERLANDGYSINSQHSRLTTLRGFCSYAYRAGWLKEEVARQMVLPDRIPRVSAVSADVHEPDEEPNQLLTPEQCVERLLQFEPDHRDVDEFWIRAIRFGKATKITIGQLFQLKWSDYNLSTGRIHIKCNGRDPERDVLNAHQN